MNFKKAFTGLLASAAVCVAPVFAHGNHDHESHIDDVFITPVACDSEAEIYKEGAFTQWVNVNHNHFTGLKVGMTNPDDDFDDTVGVRLDGGTQGIPFGPANCWTMTFVPTGDNNIDFSVVFNLPTFGMLFLVSDGNDEGLTTVDNGDGSFTTTANYSSFSFPPKTTFIGIYQNNFDGYDSFTNTVIFASVDHVCAQPNKHTGGRATNGFVADCNGFGFDL